MTAFYVLGGLLAAWALIVTALGVTRHDFPGSGGGERIVAGISVVLVAGAIGSGIITAASSEHGGEEHAEASEAAEAPEPAAGGPTLEADPSGALAFDTDTLEAQAGQVTITMDNPSSTPHNVALEGQGVDEEGEVVTEAESQVSAELQPGEYTFFCSVPGHRQGGMEGTLTVE
ncbi:MAG: plastocyanin/azurin family copper-binding protein [Thermoleophilaceae bacterium]